MPPAIPRYTVGQISTYIKELFARDFLLRSVCVEGEVSNLKYHSSGHIYFSLKDETAQINAIMFAGSRAQGLAFELKNGQKVAVTGSVSVYERDGRYQLYARQIREAGLGDLYRRFRELKERLENEGLFDPAIKKPIPVYAFRIGVVTSPTGAALQDILNIARRRNPAVKIVLCPALVQGEAAAASVAAAIRRLDKLGLDVLIVGLGGGSMEDLWAFNEEIVARAIYEAKTPVISAVGHETDVTIADFAADRRAPTPSAAAELAVFDRQDLLRLCDQRERFLKQALRRHISVALQQLSERKRRLAIAGPSYRLNEKQHRLILIREKLGGQLKTALNDTRQKITAARNGLEIFPRLLGARREALSRNAAELKKLMERQKERSRARLSLLSVRLEAASPLRRLSGGYAFVEDETGKSVGSVRTLSPGDTLRLHFSDGCALTTVKEIDLYAEGNQKT